MKKHTIKIILFLGLFLLFFGCAGDPVNTIKESSLSDYPTVMIGDALESNFSDVEWKTFETDKKQTVVEFRGKASKKFQNYLNPEDGGKGQAYTFIFQFVFHKNGKQFEIYAIEVNGIQTSDFQSKIVLDFIFR